VWKVGVHGIVTFLKSHLQNDTYKTILSAHISYTQDTLHGLCEDAWKKQSNVYKYVIVLGDCARYRSQFGLSVGGDLDTLKKWWMQKAKQWYTFGNVLHSSDGRAWNQLAIASSGQGFDTVYCLMRAATAVKPFPKAKEACLGKVQSMVQDQTMSSALLVAFHQSVKKSWTEECVDRFDRSLQELLVTEEVGVAGLHFLCRCAVLVVVWTTSFNSHGLRVMERMLERYEPYINTSGWQHVACMQFLHIVLMWALEHQDTVPTRLTAVCAVFKERDQVLQTPFTTLLPEDAELHGLPWTTPYYTPDHLHVMLNKSSTLEVALEDANTMDAWDPSRVDLNAIRSIRLVTLSHRLMSTTQQSESEEEEEDANVLELIATRNTLEHHLHQAQPQPLQLKTEDVLYIIPDTNLLLSHLSDLKRVQKHAHIVLPIPVVWELLGLQSSSRPDAALRARPAYEYVHDNLDMFQVVDTKGNTIANVDTHREMCLDTDNMDDVILGTCIALDKRRQSMEHIILVTADTNLRIKARTHNIRVMSIQELRLLLKRLQFTFKE
jgi:rRNA-processing protein FCF1